MPRVSIILTCYNQARFLREAIDSALGQTFDDFELLLVDNGSTDESVAIMRTYEADPRIRLVLHSKNQSISARFNDAVFRSRGDLITFHYGDDWYLPHKLESQAAAFDELDQSYGVVYGVLAGFNDLTGKSYEYPAMRRSGDVIRCMLSVASPGIDMITPMVRRECLERNPFDETIFAETEAIFFRIAVTHRFWFMPQAVAVHRNHGENAGKAMRTNLEQLCRVLANLRESPDLDPSLLPLVDRYETDLLRSRAWAAARLNADPRWARATFAKAVRRSPAQALHPKTLLGLALTLMPETARREINNVGHRIRRPDSNPIWGEDYT